MTLAPLRRKGSLVFAIGTLDDSTIAKITGMAMLEAVVDTEGRVTSVRVLRSRFPTLNQAAVEAVKQWRRSIY